MKDKLKQAEGEELSQLLGEILGDTPCRHKWNSNNFCVKCGFNDRNPHNGYDANCPVADPIPLDDWNVAMKWRDWAIKEYSKRVFNSSMIDMYSLEGAWLACYARPKHYLVNAALCKLESEAK